MQAYKLNVTVPEHHQLSLELPEHFPAGPAEVIVLASPRTNRRNVRVGGTLSPEAPLADECPIRGALDALREERAERLGRLVAEFGAGSDQ